MLLEAADLKAKQLIYSGQKHIDYDRTVEIDDDALIYASGENIGKKLVQILHRESLEALQQRIRLYCGMTPEMFGSLEKPINDVAQNNMVRKGIRLDNARQLFNIGEMFKHWNGSPLNKLNGWDNWQETRFKNLQGVAPNTWILPEWKQPASLSELILPQPFEVPAAWAYNWEYENNSLLWFMVGQPIIYLKKKKAEEVKVSVHVETPGSYKVPFPLPEYLQQVPQNGYRYTFYTSTHAIVYEQIDKDYYELQENELLFQIRPNAFYVRREYHHKIGFVPAWRVGFMDDKGTNGRTKVPFWHGAKDVFKDALFTVSQMNIAEAIQNFPRPTRYVTQCRGTSEAKCDAGFEAGVLPRSECKACKGSGMQTIKTPQEEIIIPLPADATNESLLDLSKLTNWDAPPQAPFEHMMGRVKEFNSRAHLAVWGTNMLIQTSGVTKTATEDENDMRQIQTGLLPFAAHTSQTYMFFANVFGSLAGADISKMEVYYEFQGQLYRRGIAQLLAQRKIATESGAPSDYIAELDKMIADIQYAGDPYGRQMKRVQDYFRPFAGMSKDAIEYAIESGKVEDFYVFLYFNYDAIFKELELDTVGFYYITDKNLQWKLVEAKTNEFIRLKQAETPETTLPALPEIKVDETTT